MAELDRKFLRRIAKIADFNKITKLFVNLIFDADENRRVLVFIKSHEKNEFRIARFLGISSEFLLDLQIKNDSELIRMLSKESKYLSFDSIPDESSTSQLMEDLKENGFVGIFPLRVYNELRGGIIIGKSGEQKETFLKISNFLYAYGTEFTLILVSDYLLMKSFRLEWEKKILLEASSILSQDLNIKEALRRIIHALGEIIACDAAVLFLKDEKDLDLFVQKGYSAKALKSVTKKFGYGVANWAVENRKAVLIPDVSKEKRYVPARPKSKSEIVVPVFRGEDIIGALVLESNRLNFFKKNHFDFLEAFASQISLLIDNAELVKEWRKSQQLESDMKIASKIQKSLLPRYKPKIKGYSIFGVNIPSQTVGGDLFDFVDFHDGTLGFAIGDVTGKGIPGAILMATLYASLRSVARHKAETSSVVYSLNKMMFQFTEEDKFASFFYGVLDPLNEKITYTNAGHDIAILLRADGKVEKLVKGGIVLGFMDKYQYEQETVQIRSGDVLILYTDGVTEAQNFCGREFGLKGLVDTVKMNTQKTARNIGNAIFREVKRFSGSDHFTDDITIMVLKKL